MVLRVTGHIFGLSLALTEFKDLKRKEAHDIFLGFPFILTTGLYSFLDP